MAEHEFYSPRMGTDAFGLCLWGRPDLDCECRRSQTHGIADFIFPGLCVGYKKMECCQYCKLYTAVVRTNIRKTICMANWGNIVGLYQVQQPQKTGVVDAGYLQPYQLSGSRNY